MIRIFLANLLYFEPLNFFLYSWRFINMLEHSETNPYLKKIYHWFAPISIVLLPLCFFCFVPAWIVEISKVEYYGRQEANHNYYRIERGLIYTIDSLTVISNLISCTILALVVRYLHK